MLNIDGPAAAHPNGGCIKDETFRPAPRLVKMMYVELFTQHRFKANIGQLLKPSGITPCACPHH
ncbi:hypothetical protein E8E68_10475 [Pseudomonas sp. BN607]|nr:hypothetical protein [Pseudomonas sp. BN607]